MATTGAPPLARPLVRNALNNIREADPGAPWTLLMRLRLMFCRAQSNL